MKLSHDQASACEAIRSWVYRRCDTWRDGVPSEVLTFAGYAGTGKTTVLGILADEFQKRNLLVAYATFTGRASTILSRKLADQGVITSNKMLPTSERQLEGKFAKYFLDHGEERMPFCGTLHRLLYAPMINEETEELLGWRTRMKLDRRYGLIVVDEASMVGDSMLEDLSFHGVPILAVGDHGQLSPVMDNGNLMKNPMVRLEKIHRQAEGNSIIQLSKVIRETGRLDRSLGALPGSAVSFGSRKDVGMVYETALANTGDKTLDVGALCWTNKTRMSVNRTVRKTRGFTGPPKACEPLICLRNADELANGMRGVLVRDAEAAWRKARRGIELSL